MISIFKLLIIKKKNVEEVKFLIQRVKLIGLDFVKVREQVSLAFRFRICDEIRCDCCHLRRHHLFANFLLGLISRDSLVNLVELDARHVQDAARRTLRHLLQIG